MNLPDLKAKQQVLSHHENCPPRDMLWIPVNWLKPRSAHVDSSGWKIPGLLLL